VADIYVSLAELEAANWQLSEIVTEFEKATERADDLEGAIGDPFGRSELREAAEDFEDRWNHKRDQLKENLEGLNQQLGTMVKAFNKLDIWEPIPLKAPSK